MAEQGEIFAGRDVEGGVGDGEGAEFNEVVAAAAGAELFPGFFMEAFGDGGDAPVFVHDIVMATDFEFTAHAEAGFVFEEVCQSVFLAGDDIGLALVDGEFHATRDIDTDGVGDDRVFSREDAANGKPVTDMGIGHEGTGEGDREGAGVGDLFDGFGVQIVAPLLPGGEFGAWGVGGSVEGAGERGAVGVVEVGGGIGDDVHEVGFDLGAIESAREESTHVDVGEFEGIAKGNAEIDEVLGVHWN